MNIIRSYLIIWIFTNTVCAAPSFHVPAGLAGHWEGKGKIIVSWCEKDSLDFSITIHSDGTVTGTIGDAVLENGTVRRNYWMLRLLNNPEFLVEGELSGPLVAEEGIVRKSAHFLMLDMAAPGKLTGGFHSGGLHMGGKKSMVFTVFGIRLIKIAK